MDLPIIIIEYGQQRQRLKLNRFRWTVDKLLELFSRTFEIKFNLEEYEILFENKRLDSMSILDFSQLGNYQRFKIQLNHTQATKQLDSMTDRSLSYSSIIDNRNEIASLKQRLNTASSEIIKVTVLINAIYQNYQNLIDTLTNKKNHSNELTTKNLPVPPGYKSLSNQTQLHISPQDSQCTDEGIDHDTGSVSIFESAHSDYDFESIYLECREDLTIINQPLNNNNNSKPEWRQQPYRPRPKFQSQFNDKPRTKKPISLNKAPLPPEKKKNIPCKYAAGGNCKRGSQCRFIHVV